MKLKKAACDESASGLRALGYCLGRLPVHVCWQQPRPSLLPEDAADSAPATDERPNGFRPTLLEVVHNDLHCQLGLLAVELDSFREKADPFLAHFRSPALELGEARNLPV